MGTTPRARRRRNADTARTDAGDRLDLPPVERREEPEPVLFDDAAMRAIMAKPVIRPRI